MIGLKLKLARMMVGDENNNTVVQKTCMLLGNHWKCFIRFLLVQKWCHCTIPWDKHCCIQLNVFFLEELNGFVSSIWYLLLHANDNFGVISLFFFSLMKMIIFLQPKRNYSFSSLAVLFMI